MVGRRRARRLQQPLLPEDWDRFAPLMENAIRRVPAVEDADIVQLVNGPEGFTPDNEFVLGESEVHGFFVAAGFCAHGIAGAGGVGRVMAEWILDGESSFDTWKMDIRRFGPAYRSRDHALARTVEVYSTYYDIHYPNEERQAGRPLRRSPAYGALADLGCAFGEKSGWERPNWFTPNEAAGDRSNRPRGWAGEHWSPAIEAEALACRDTVALFDETSFSKMEVVGPGAATFLDRVCANEIDRPVGQRHLHPAAATSGRHRVRPHRDPAGRRPLPARDRHRVRATTTSAGSTSSRTACPKATRCRGPGRHLGLGVLRPLGPGGPGPPPAPDHGRPWATRRSRTSRRSRCRSARCRCSRCGSPTSASSAGSSTARPSTAPRSGTGSGRQGRATAWWPAATGRSTRCGSRRATGCGASTSRPRTTPTRPASASRSGSTSPAASSAGTPWPTVKATGPARRLRCLRARRPARRAARLRAGAGRRRDRRPGHERRTRATGSAPSIAFAYLPADRADIGRPVEVEVFGEWIGAEVVKDPLYDPDGQRIRG